MLLLNVIGLAIAGLFALVHLFGGQLVFLSNIPRSRWLSVAGGSSVAYVFVHLLPELAESQGTLARALEGTIFERVEAHVYLIALAGLTVFYSLEQLIRTRAVQREMKRTSGPFWLHLSFFAVYNGVIGYLLIQSEVGGLANLMLYGGAMALHLLVVDQGLRKDHGAIYHSRGRYVLAAAPMFGSILALSTTVPPITIAALVAFIGGSVILNVLKEELPEDRQSDFKAFAVGAFTYAAVLVASL